jgi:hypothetical protein
MRYTHVHRIEECRRVATQGVPVAPLMHAVQVKSVLEVRAGLALRHRNVAVRGARTQPSHGLVGQVVRSLRYFVIGKFPKQTLSSSRARAPVPVHVAVFTPDECCGAPDLPK